MTNDATDVQPYGHENANDVQPHAELVKNSPAEGISSKENKTD